MELLGDRHQFNHTNGENRLNKAPPTQNFETHPNTFRRTSHLKSQLAADYSYDFIRAYKERSLAFSMRYTRRRVYAQSVPELTMICGPFLAENVQDSWQIWWNIN